jgi:hypothetical protein
MIINKLFFMTMLVLVHSALFGCTKRFWYDSFKLGGESRCQYEMPTETESGSCMERLDKRSYEAYEKEREENKP